MRSSAVRARGRVAERSSAKTGGLHETVVPFRGPRDDSFWSSRGVEGPVDPNFWRVVRLQLDENPLVDPYRQNPWVRAAVRKLARSCARPPWRIFREDPSGKDAAAFDDLRTRHASLRASFHREHQDVGAREYLGALRAEAPWISLKTAARAAGAHALEGGEWYELFRDVNPQLQGRQLWDLTTIFYTCGGESFWILQRKGNPIKKGEIPDEIWVRGRDGWAPRVDPKTQLVSLWTYSYRAEGESAIKKLIFQPHQVVQFANFGTTGDLRGESPLEAVALELRSYHNAALFNESFFKNGAVMGGYLWTDAQIPRSMAKEMLDEFRTKHAGTRKAFEPDILTHGLKWQPSAVTHKDMEFPKLYDMCRDAILAVLGVPRHEVGVTAELNFATAGAERTAFWHDGVIPILQYYEDVTQSKVFAPTGQKSTFGMFDLSAVEALREDLVSKLDAGKKLFDLSYPPNEINSRLQLGMMENDWGRYGYLPGTVVPAGEAKATPDPDDDEDEDTGGNEPGVRRRALDFEQWDAIARALLVPGERTYETRYLRFVSKVAAETQRLISDTDPKAVESAEPFLFDAADGKKKLARALGNIYERLYAAAEREAEAELVATKAEALPRFEPTGELRKPSDPKAVELISFLKERIKGSVDTIREQLRRILAEGIEAGEDRDGLRERSRKVFGSIKSRVRKFIRRNEVSAVANGARDIVFEKHAIKMFDWLTARDELVRESHVAFGEAGSRPRGHNWATEIGQSYMVRRPHDPQAPMEETANCFLPGTVIGGRPVGASKAIYSGAARRVETLGGKSLSVTANHPILTNRGWLAAKKIREGDYLLSDGSDIGEAMLGNIDDQHGEATVDDVFETLSANGGVFRSVFNALDFHGEAQRFRNAYVDVVGVYREVFDRRMATGTDDRRELGDVSLTTSGPTLLGESAPLQFGGVGVAPSRRDVCSPDLSGPYARTHSRPFDPLLLGPASKFDAVLLENPIDTDSVGHKSPVVAEPFGDAEHRLAGLVQPDRVRTVVDFAYVGPVFDVQTANGWLQSNGIISHNCRCVLVPALEE